VRALEEQYKDRVEVELTMASSEEGLAAAERHEFGSAKHGLVCIDSKGEVAFVMPGHRFTQDDIDEKLRPLLGE